VITVRFVRVAGFYLCIDRFEKRIWITEISIEINLGEQQSQILEIFPDDRRFAAYDTTFIQTLGMLDDILIVFEQKLRRQLFQVEQLRGERVVEVMNIVLVHPFELFIAKMLGELTKRLNAEERLEPLVQGQLLNERNLRPTVGAATLRGGRTGDGSRDLARASARHQRPSVSNISRWKSSSIRRTFHVSSAAFRFSRLLSPLTKMRPNSVSFAE
jgi:hypothetical protein